MDESNGMVNGISISTLTENHLIIIPGKSSWHVQTYVSDESNKNGRKSRFDRGGNNDYKVLELQNSCLKKNNDNQSIKII